VVAVAVVLTSSAKQSEMPNRNTNIDALINIFFTFPPLVLFSTRS
jgi:ABC-type methionine transport system permease subunit